MELFHYDFVLISLWIKEKVIKEAGLFCFEKKMVLWKKQRIIMETFNQTIDESYDINKALERLLGWI